MTDTVSRAVRSRMMSSVRSKDTKPEIAVRHCLFSRGFRYRLHRRDLPGSPDLVFPKYSAVIFIHGCFWHQHDCPKSRLPETRLEWWKAKLEGNRRRDELSIRCLREQGWRVLIIWECAIRKPLAQRAKNLDILARQASSFLISSKPQLELPRSSSVGCLGGKHG